jgi:RNA polymerase sigma-70 factor (ECF subfamily)
MSADAIKSDLLSYTERMAGLVASKVDPQDCEDVQQDIWLSALEGLDRFRGESDIGTWFYTIARRRIVDYYRKKRSRSMREPTRLAMGLSDPRAEIHDRLLMEQIIAALPAKSAQALREYVDGVTFEESALDHGIGYEGARSRYRNAKAQARRIFR